MTKYRTTGYHKEHCVYHTNPDCQYIQRGVIEITDEQVERMGLRLCSGCDPDRETPRKDQDHSIYNLAVQAGRENE